MCLLAGTGVLPLKLLLLLAVAVLLGPAVVRVASLSFVIVLLMMKESTPKHMAAKTHA